MSVVCTKENGVGLVVLSGPLIAATVEAFREQFTKNQTQQPETKNFVFDLTGVDFMDSAGLGALIAALKRVTEHGGDLKLACLQKKPRMVFEITRAYKVFEIFDTVDDALRSIDGE